MNPPRANLCGRRSVFPKYPCQRAQCFGIASFHGVFGVPVRDRAWINTRLGKTKDTKGHFEAKQLVMATVHESAGDLTRINGCDFRRPCNKPGCYFCACAIPRDLPRHSVQLPDAVAAARQAASTTRPRYFRPKGGVWMTEPFRGLPEDMVHPITIDFSLVGWPMNMRDEASIWRTDFKEFIYSTFPDAIIRMRFDISPVWADQAALDYPDHAIAPQFRSDPRPHIPAFNFHGHLLGFFGDASKAEIGTGIRDHYAGQGRVLISTPTEITYDDQGRARGGLQGYAEYASMEKFESKLFDEGNIETGEGGCDNVMVFQEHLRLSCTWSRGSRLVKYGDRPDQVRRARERYGNLRKVHRARTARRRRAFREIYVGTHLTQPGIDDSVTDLFEHRLHHGPISCVVHPHPYHQPLRGPACRAASRL